MCAAWALLLGFVYFLVQKKRRGAIVVAVVVFSHWFLDALVHRPDLPLAPGGALCVGVGVWNSVAATLAIEGLMFAAGLVLYLQGSRARDRIGRIGFWALIAILPAAYCGAAFGPPPPSVKAVAWAGIVGGSVTALWVIGSIGIEKPCGRIPRTILITEEQ
jgi:hypothetical protein